MSVTKIEWADRVWNPVRGCSRVSQGCDHCYAERMATRFSGPGYWGEGFAKPVHGQPHWTGRVALVEEMLLKPLSWLRGRQPAGRPRERVFVNSMSDLFHEDLPDEAIDRVFAVMALCPHLDFLVLTKRPERMREYFAGGRLWAGVRIQSEVMRLTYDYPIPLPEPWSRIAELALAAAGYWPLPNVWLGTSVEDQATADARVPLLLDTPAAVHFASYEPALGLVDFRPWLTRTDVVREPLHDGPVTLKHYPGGVDWIICGGESGPGARPMHPDWARSVRDQCAAAGVAYFFKQWGEWVPSDYGTHSIAPDGSWAKNDENGYPPGWVPPNGTFTIARLGKKAAGRLLDGREHNEFPRSPLALRDEGAA